ncbi:MAG: GNAT family N-acetyltransferase [Parafilimonas sp.]|nr:GNAT family N-acetyltransferase [Parafilimonas sp.]
MEQTDSIIIRSATVDDLNTLLQFEQGVIEAERPFDPTLKSGHIDYYDLNEMIEATHTELAVAELNNQVIASGYARIKQAQRDCYTYEKYAYLGFMYVVPEYRGRGIINKIIDHLKAWAIAQNLNELRLEVYTENEPAVKAYEKIGFSKLITEMRMPVE